jgi:hypothetical protein
MSTTGITASVGQGGVNKAADVRVVQELLLARGFSTIGRATGVCDDATIGAVVAFQRGYLRSPDGRVDPGGRTWRHLAGTYAGTAVEPPEDTSPVTRTVARPAPQTINVGLTPVNNDFMLARLGAPRSSYATTCQEPTNERLRRNLVLDTVGPFRVTGLLPAVLSLKAVMADIAREQPRVYRALGTAGMLCCRYVRGSTTSISNHSWGTAIDLTLDGVLDAYGDDKVQVGLTLIAPIFNRHGWFWGAAFRKEDAMHFEGSRAEVEQWATQLR